MKLTACTRCNKVFYCSTDCKLRAWAERHKDECIREPSRVQASAENQREESVIDLGRSDFLYKQPAKPAMLFLSRNISISLCFFTCLFQGKCFLRILICSLFSLTPESENSNQKRVMFRIQKGLKLINARYKFKTINDPVLTKPEFVMDLEENYSRN